MNWGLIYAEAKSWQTVIGSVLGFGALIGGALFNYRLNRKRDDLLRADQSETIAAALYGEIVPMRTALAKLARGVTRRHYKHGAGRHVGQPFGPEFREPYRIPKPRLYHDLAEQVGLLPADVLLPVVDFYSNYEEAVDGLMKLEEKEGREVTYGVLWFLSPALDAIEKITPTLIEIERMIGMADSVDDVDIASAIKLRDQEIEDQEEWLNIQPS